MASYHPVSPKFWFRARKRGWTDSQITLALYLWTCEHRVTEGLFRLPKAYAVDDLLWTAEKLDEQLVVLDRDGYAAYDEEAGVVLLFEAVEGLPQMSPKQIKGAVNQLAKLPRTSLWDRYLKACETHCRPLADAIEDRWPRDLGALDTHSDGSFRSSSTSNSSSNSKSPPHPRQAGEQKETGVEAPPTNSRAHGTNPRARAEQFERQRREVVARGAHEALNTPTDEERENFERFAEFLQAKVPGYVWAQYLEGIKLIGVDSGVLVIAAGDGTRWLRDRRATIERAAEAVDVGVRVATSPEYVGADLAAVTR